MHIILYGEAQTFKLKQQEKITKYLKKVEFCKKKKKTLHFLFSVQRRSLLKHHFFHWGPRCVKGFHCAPPGGADTERLCTAAHRGDRPASTSSLNKSSEPNVLLLLLLRFDRKGQNWWRVLSLSLGPLHTCVGGSRVGDWKFVCRRLQKSDERRESLSLFLCVLQENNSWKEKTSWRTRTIFDQHQHNKWLL